MLAVASVRIEIVRAETAAVVVEEQLDAVELTEVDVWSELCEGAGVFDLERKQSMVRLELVGWCGMMKQVDSFARQGPTVWLASAGMFECSEMGELDARRP